MILPGKNHLAFDGFDYGTNDAHVQGQDGSQVPVKLLNFIDKGSGIAISFLFKPEEFEKFKNTIFAGQIVPATEMPRIVRP